MAEPEIVFLGAVAGELPRLAARGFPVGKSLVEMDQQTVQKFIAASTEIGFKPWTAELENA